MLKKLAFLSLVLIFAQTIYAQEVAIQITPTKVYKTSNNSVKEGDYLDFVVVNDAGNLKKGSKVIGLVTEVTENGFAGRVATVYIEQFKTETNKNLKGIIYQKGNNHPIFFEYFSGVNSNGLGFSPFRGGEAFLVPNKDIYTLYLEVKEWKKFYW